MESEGFKECNLLSCAELPGENTFVYILPTTQVVEFGLTRRTIADSHSVLSGRSLLEFRTWKVVSKGLCFASEGGNWVNAMHGL